MSWRKLNLILVAGVSLGLALQAARAAEATPAYPDAILPEPMSEETGFTAIFDGKTLRGWKGDNAYWRVENGTIVGEMTNKDSRNKYLIWQGGKPADFELKLDYRISDMGNSGIQYRGTELPGVKGGIRGYQADIDGRGWGQMFYEKLARPRGSEAKRVTGQNYHEWGRTFLALPGQFSYVGNGKPQRVLALLADAETLARTLSDDWNTMYLIVRGNQMIHVVNGHVTTIVIDDDVANRRMDGLLALQIHGGEVAKVEFRNIRLKTL